jgi:IS605 OrfB family transposase
MKPNKKQKTILDDWMNTSNYVYNKTVEFINDGHCINFQMLRDTLVTKNTKKNNAEYIEIANDIKSLHILKKDGDHNKIKELIKEKQIHLRNSAKKLKSEKNTRISDWEYNTPKEIRAGAVNDVCKAYKTGFSNLKAGNINHFKLGFRKYTGSKCIVVPKNFLKQTNGTIQLAPAFFDADSNFKMGPRNIKKYKHLEITYDSRIIKKNNEYWFVIPIPIKNKVKKQYATTYCGVDPGIRTFMTTFGNDGYTEYTHRQDLLNALFNKLRSIKKMRTNKLRNRIRKKSLSKIETRKTNLINELHWKVINDMVAKNDYIFYGDIKSHDIVKNGKNRSLNRNCCDLKLYQFKERLLYKATTQSKKVILVNESFTTQTCSFCGVINKPGLSKVYTCKTCNCRVGRDINASKNILMKGLIKLL